MNGRRLLPVFLTAAVLHGQGAAQPQGGSLAGLLQGSNPGLLAAMAVALGLGAVHALSPGHGKTIVAAYLVGSRSTARHAALLGLVVTFTHTVSVFLLGFATLFLSRFVLPEKIYPLLGTVSGLTIVWVGGSLLAERWRAVSGRPRHVHSHVPPEGEVSMASLMALGASGGLVPCPSALVLLLSSVSLGRVALGMTLLVAFSTGLAVVLMAIGLAAVYAKHWLPDAQKTSRGVVFRYAPVASAALITGVGALMTAAALGVVRVGI